MLIRSLRSSDRQRSPELVLEMNTTMSYMALYRKFRPNEFEDVKGQDAIVRTLKNQDQKQIVSDTHTCSVEQGEPEKQRLLRYLQKQLTVNTR